MSFEANPPDRKWQELQDAHALGEFLTPQDRAFLAEYEGTSPQLRAEAVLMGQFHRLGQVQLQAATAGTPSTTTTLADLDPRGAALVTSAVDQFLGQLSNGTAVGADVAENGEGTASVLRFPETDRQIAPSEDELEDVSGLAVAAGCEGTEQELGARISEVSETSDKRLRILGSTIAAAAVVALSFMAGRGFSPEAPDADQPLAAAALTEPAGQSSTPSAEAVVTTAQIADASQLGGHLSQSALAKSTPAVILSGSGTLAGRALAAADLHRGGDGLEDIDVGERLCLSSGVSQFCADAGSRLRWHGDSGAVELISGHGEYSIASGERPSDESAAAVDPREVNNKPVPRASRKLARVGAAKAGSRPAGSSKSASSQDDSTTGPKVARLQVVVAGVRVRADGEGGSYAVQAPSARHEVVDVWRVEVKSGEVSVDDQEGTMARLRAGDSLDGRIRGGQRRGSSSEVDSAASRPRGRRGAEPAIARELARARGLRGAKRFRAAAKSYEKVLKQYPDSPRSRTAWVSLGQLYAGPLKRPRSALRAFGSYLASGGGPLSEEARLGQISALRELKLKTRERKAIEGFLRTYPSSSYADALRTRLEKMSSRVRRR